MTHQHETWQDEPQREPRTIREAFQIDTDEVEDKSADEERGVEDYLDTARGLWE
jgi:hypothetical protein